MEMQIQQKSDHLQVAPAKHYDYTTFIDVPLDLFVNLGDQWFLNLENHYQTSFVSIILPGCNGCERLLNMLYTAQQTLKEKLQMPLFVYVVTLGRDFASEQFWQQLNISKVPALFILNAKGRLISLVPNLLTYKDDDPTGVLRVDVELITQYALRITSKRSI